MSEEVERGIKEYRYAMAGQLDRWVPANGGTETPLMTRSGIRVLYCFNPAKRRHAYLNLDTDIIMGHDEVDF